MRNKHGLTPVQAAVNDVINTITQLEAETDTRSDLDIPNKTFAMAYRKSLVRLHNDLVDRVPSLNLTFLEDPT